MPTTSIVRGCGTRKKGGIYIEIPLGPGGLPVEYFLTDPPFPWPIDVRPLSAQGVSALEREQDGVLVTHVLDWVGTKHYPNVADFVEEVRRFGLSRMVPKTFDFSKLGPSSRLITLHQKAFVGNYQDLWKRLPKDLRAGVSCPKSVQGALPKTGVIPKDHPKMHLAKSTMCAAFWYFDIEGAARITIGEKKPGEDDFQEVWARRMPSFTYHTTGVIEGKRDYQLGIFASWPIAFGITVIRDPEGESHEEALAKLEKDKCLIPVKVEDE